ncbi:hypothetical protein T439DRAFT_43188 [Meredithblackwellia eburnea MCA 4105]
MASLNWAILAPSTNKPTPLPSEKFLLTTNAVSISLFPSAPGAPLTQTADKTKEYRATGVVHTSNQRVVFVADGAATSSLADGSASVAGGAASTVAGKLIVNTLSIPYSHLLDGRFVQPWFAATYYEALLGPARGGGLEGPHIARFSFKESGGYQFYELVQEMRDRVGAAAGRAAAVEPLPLYSPPSPPATNSPTLADAPPIASHTEPLIPTMPTEDDLSAAQVARSEEEREENARTRADIGGDHADGPPAYTV